MTDKYIMKQPAKKAVATNKPPPPRLRLPLATIRDVRRELARLYREGKSGVRDVSEVSRLANVLQVLSRCIELAEFESRLEKLEKNQNETA